MNTALLCLLLSTNAYAKPDAPAPAPESPPADAAPGASRETVTSTEGDTLERLGERLGFLPAELGAWSGLTVAEDAPLPPGTTIVVWRPPAEPAPAEAVAERPPRAPRDDAGGIGLVIAARIGPDVPLSALRPFVLSALEVGWQLPVADRLLEVYGLVGYATPPADGASETTGVGGFTYDLRQQQLSLGLGARARLRELAGPLSLVVGAGPQLDLLQTVAEGTSDAGEPAGEHREQFSRPGFHAHVGVELPLGPGALLGELHTGWSRLDRVITGQASTARITPQLGYRLML